MAGFFYSRFLLATLLVCWEATLFWSNRSSENVTTRLSEILDLDSIQVVDCSVQRTSGRRYVFESSFSIIRCFEFSSRTSVFNFISTGTSGGIPSYLRFTAFISIFIGIYMRTLSRYTI